MADGDPEVGLPKMGADRVLITGASGWTGSYLSRLLLSQGASVFGTFRSRAVIPGVTGCPLDLTDGAQVDEVIREARPDWVFHLGAAIPNAAPEISPADYLNINVTGTYHVLDAVRRLKPEARVLVASSSAVYGQPVFAENPITESTPFQPHSLYAASKAAQEMVAGSFFTEHGLHIVRCRTFNQTGPGEGANLVCGALARQVARIEAGLQEPVLKAITLVARRDFSDVRDVVTGYLAALEHGSPGEAYNICSGRSVAVEQIAEELLGLSSRSDIQVLAVGPPPGPGAIIEQIGCAERLAACSGWSPVVSSEQSLRDLLDSWRERVSTTARDRGEQDDERVFTPGRS